MLIALVALCALLGLLIGSFLNVVIHRVPRGESVVSPPSACPGCGSPIRPRDNVPVLSWLVLRGRCRSCGEAISGRYPLVELLTAVVFALLALRVGLEPALPAFLYLGAVGVALAMIDIDTRRLPDALTLPSYVVLAVLLGGAAVAEGGAGALIRALLGGLALYALYFALAVAKPGAMGFGDVKLAGVLGICLGWLGWGTWAVGMFAGFFLGGVWGIGLLLVGGAGRKTKVPFGPFMLAGALLAVLAGQSLADAYLRLSGL